MAGSPVDKKEQGAGLAEFLRRLDGRQLFERETFGGNGRTCRTCHSKATGTTSIADVADRIYDPTDPLFLHDGLDEDGIGTTRIRAHATIRMTIPLPPGIMLADQGHTPAEKRGRRFLVDVPFNPPAKDGACALCHSGPMLNETNRSHEAFGIPQGNRFFDTGITIVNAPNNPILTFIVDDGVNPPQSVSTPDLGLLLNPNPSLPPSELVPRIFLVNLFKIPTLWGIGDTAPYFHDNGAKTLRDAVHHYVRFFNFPYDVDQVGSCTLGGLIHLTEDDVDDITAYLKLL